jgi:hypothetical protein
MKKLLVLLMLLPIPALACNPVQVGNVTAMLHRAEAAGLSAFTQNAECYYWPSYYEAAGLMFAAGQKNAALQWLYAGEIRARMAAGLDPEPARNNALMVALNQGIATPLKTYARSDRDAWLTAIDAALAWDAAHPLTPEPALVIGAADAPLDAANFARVYEQVRTGLSAMRADIASKSQAELGQGPQKIDLTK